MKLPKQQPNPHGIGLIESLMSIAVISVLASFSYFIATNVMVTSTESRFERDVATINAAVRTYLATGGNLATATSSADVIDRLKQSLSAADRRQQVGSSGSLVDPRLTPVLVAVDERIGAARIAWDGGLQRFVLTHDAVAGIVAFNFTTPTEETPHDTARHSSVRYAPSGGWVWSHHDAPQPERMEITPITSTATYAGPYGTAQ